MQIKFVFNLFSHSSACKYRHAPSSSRAVVLSAPKTWGFLPAIVSMTSTISANEVPKVSCRYQKLFLYLLYVRFVTYRSTFLLKYLIAVAPLLSAVFNITAPQSSRISYGLHPSSSYDLHPKSFSADAQLVKGATPTTRSGTIFLSLTPLPVNADTKVPMVMKDAT